MLGLHRSVIKRLTGIDPFNGLPAREFAKLNPYRSVVHTISGDRWYEEECRIEQILLAGGYTRTDHLEFSVIAMEALVGDLHDIAMEKGIERYNVSSEVNENGDLEIIFIFAHVRHAMLFKMALP